MHSVYSLAFPLVLAALALGSMACTRTDSDTLVMLAITSETDVPTELNRLQVRVQTADGSVAYDGPYEVDEQSFFPTTLQIIPRDEESLDRPIEIFLEGTLEGDPQPVVLRRAVVSYVEGRSLYLPMPLRMACFHIEDCNASQTCSGGTCVAADVSDRLVDYREEYVFDTTSCFDDKECLVNADETPVSDDCSFALPSAASARVGQRPTVNVSIEWAAADTRIIVLDEGDAVEGWTVSGDDRGLLSQGVCQALQAEAGTVPNKANAVFVSTACPAKQVLQAKCGSSVGLDRPNP